MTVLQVSEKRGSGTRKEPAIPCYRCLFDKPISEGLCDPQTCDMLEFWLDDEDFSWQKYYFGWTLRLELKNAKIYEPSKEELWKSPVFL